MIRATQSLSPGSRLPASVQVNSSTIEGWAVELRRILAAYQRQVGFDQAMELGRALEPLATEILKMKEGVAVRNSAAPEPVMPSALSLHLFDAEPPLKRYAQPATNGSNQKGLTPRMAEVAKMIAEGRSTREIGYLLGLSAKTVETHRLRLMKRVGVNDIAGLVRYVIRSGLIAEP